MTTYIIEMRHNDRDMFFQDTIKSNDGKSMPLFTKHRDKAKRFSENDAQQYADEFARALGKDFNVKPF
jgi:hypothetical protein